MSAAAGPHVAFADGTAAGITIRSPTALTNSVRRPKSPRKPGPFLAAESFSRAYNGSADPKVRRRTHEEMGRNGIKIAQSSEDKKFQPRLCMPMGVSELLQLKGGAGTGGAGAGCMTTTVEKSKDFMIRYEASAKDNFGTCAGVEEVEPDTHATRNRGGDAEFFKERASDDGDSMAQNSSESGSDPLRDLQLEEEYQKHGSNSRSKSVPTTRASTTRGREKGLPGSIDVVSNEEGISPPRVGRLDTRGFEPKVFGSSQDDLLETRLRLFQQGQRVDSSDPELRLSRALGTIDEQEKTIEALEMELSFARAKLDDLASKYEATRSLSEEKKKMAAELRARTVETQKMLQEQQAREEQEIERLAENLTQLQAENSSLKIALREATGSSNANPQSPNVSIESISPEAVSSTQVIALRAEIVDLKAKLAESHAANISDNSSLNSFADVEQLRRQVRRYQKELEDFRRKEKNSANYDASEQRELLSKQEMNRLNQQMEEIQQEYEVKLNDAMASEAKTNAEVIKLRAMVHRLERERARWRSQSSSSIPSIASGPEDSQKQLRQAHTDIQKLRKQLEDEHNSSKNSMNQFQKEIKDLRKKLAESESKSHSKNDSVSNHAMESKFSMLEDEIEFRKANEASLRSELKMHKSLLREARHAIMEIDETPGDDHSLIIIDALRAAVRQLHAEVEKMRPFEESARLAQSDIERRKQVETELNLEIKYLQEKIGHLEEAAKDSVSNGDLEKHVNEIEESFREKIASMQTRLEKSEFQCKVEEERVKELSHLVEQKDAERKSKMQELEEELDRMKDLEVKLQSELAQLKLHGGPFAAPDSPINERSSLNEDSALSNVVRLRKELAVARARLATARDQSDASPSKRSPTTPNYTLDDRSTKSGEEESCWAPPGVENAPSFADTVWSTISDEREEKKVDEPDVISASSGTKHVVDSEKQKQIARLAQKYSM